MLAAFVILVPMIGFLSVSIRQIEEAEQAIIDKEVKYHTSRLVQALNERIAVSIQALLVLSNSQSARNKDWAGLYQEARQFVSANPHYVAVTLVDTSGTLEFVTTIPYGRKTFAPNYLHLVHEVLRTGNANLSGPFRVPIAEGHRVAISLPVNHDGGTTKVLRLILSTDSISEILKAQQLPRGWIAGIADREGRILARSINSETYIGQLASDSFRKAIRHNQLDSFKGITLEGHSTTSFVSPVFNRDWYVAVAVPDSILNERHHRSLVKMSIVGIFAAATVFGLMLLLANFMSQQSRLLESAVSAGDLQAESPRNLLIREFRSFFENYLSIRKEESNTKKTLNLAETEKETIRDLYDRAPCGYHSLAPDGSIVRINKTELDWLGLRLDQALGKQYTNFLTAESKEKFNELFPEFLSTGHVEGVEIELVRGDGKVIPVIVNATLIRDDQGRPLMSRTTLFDISERKKYELQLKELSNTDALTGLTNRRHFYELAEAEINRARRHGSDLVLALADVDHFKAINDRHGHASGDRVLVKLSDIFRQSLRTIDLMARIGGEEFVFVLPNTRLDTGEHVLNRLRADIASAAFQSGSGDMVTVTISIGVTRLRPDDASLDGILSRADSLLYEAKRNGRNQLQSAG